MANSVLIDATFNPSKENILSCASTESYFQIRRESNETAVLAKLPSAASAICCAQSGVVIIGTEDGSVHMVPPEGNKTMHLYQHPEEKGVDNVAISEDDDTVIATIGMDVVVISRVLLSTVVPLTTATCIKVPPIGKRKDVCGFSSITIQGSTVLLCESSGRGGIVVIQGGKYRCRLAGSHEHARFTSRAFRLVGCGVVCSNDEGMVVVGAENWGDFCVWHIPQELDETSSVEVTMSFSLPMRSTLIRAFSLCHLGPERVSFAVAYMASSLVARRRKELQKTDPGWVSVFTLPRDSFEKLQQTESLDGDSDVDDMELDEEQFLEDLDQTDLDAFHDLSEESHRQVSVLKFTPEGALIVATKGLLYGSGNLGDSSSFVRMFVRNGKGDGSGEPKEAKSFSCVREISFCWGVENKEDDG